MESQRLTDADFVDAAPAPATEPQPTTEADYPGRADFAEPDSLAAEAAPSAPVAVSSDDATDTPDAELSASDPDASPAETTVPQTDAEKRLADLEARYEQERQRAEALESEKRQRETAEAEQRIQAEWNQFDARQRQEKLAVLNQARKMSDDAAAQYLDYHTTRLQQERDNKWAEVVEARESQQRNLITYLARDKFIDSVITKFDLPQEAAGELREYDPSAMSERQFQTFVDRWTEIKTLRQHAVQAQREHVAQQRIATGADAMGGLRGGGASPLPDHLNPKSADYDPVAAYGGAGTWQRTRF